MKIAVMSDLHLGFRQYGSIEREDDFYNHFLKICEEINKENPDIVIIAGDIFDKPNPSPKAISMYRNGVGNLNSDITIAIKGNHTMIARVGHYSIDEYFGDDEFEGYYLLDDGTWSANMYAMETQYDMEFNKYKNKKLQIDGITYRSNSQLDEFLEVQKILSGNITKDETYRILVVHQAFKEFCGFTGEELSIHDIDYSKYDAVICGHIHGHFHIKLDEDTWFIQPGSIERMNTAEALDEQNNGKGFYIIDTNKNSVEFHQVKCSRKFFLGDINIYNEEDLEKHFELLNKALTKLKEPAIISYNFKSYLKNNELLRNKIGSLKNNVLLDKSDIYDETEEEISLEVSEKEMPTVAEAIKMYGEKSDLTDEEIQLAVDIYNVLGKDEEKDISELLDKHYEKYIKKEEKGEFNDPELEEFIEYFMR